MSRPGRRGPDLLPRSSSATARWSPAGRCTVIASPAGPPSRACRLMSTTAQPHRRAQHRRRHRGRGEPGATANRRRSTSATASGTRRAATRAAPRAGPDDADGATRASDRRPQHRASASCDAHEIVLAENSIFTGRGDRLAPADRLRAVLLRPARSRARRGAIECQPDLVSVEATLARPGDAIRPKTPRVRPRFNSVRYGTPTYCQLAESCAEEITRGADDESEMGAFHDLYAAAAGREPARTARRVHRLPAWTPGSSTRLRSSHAR